MDLQMNGKQALVTGASAGIGKAIAFALAREGNATGFISDKQRPNDTSCSR